MNPIKKAIAEIKYRIPKAILEAVFTSGSTYWRATSRSTIDEQIESLVVRPRVMVDCNLIGGIEVLVPLEGLAMERPMDYTTVIHIPKDRTRGLSINSVLNVSFINSAAVTGYAGVGMTGGAAQAYGGVDNSAMMAAASGVMSSYDKIPMTSTARVQLIAENTILIKDGFNIPYNAQLRCVLANDENLSGLQLRSYPYFCNLVEYAVKAYIYNELIVTIDEGELRYGQTLGVFKEIVASYADSNQNYREYLTDVMESILVMNDIEQYGRLMKMVLRSNC